jgi:hypothetical protein
MVRVKSAVSLVVAAAMKVYRLLPASAAAVVVDRKLDLPVPVLKPAGLQVARVAPMATAMVTATDSQAVTAAIPVHYPAV